MEYKPYKKADNCPYKGEMMLADYASQMRDVVACAGNKRRDIYNAVRKFLLRHGIPQRQKRTGIPVLVLGDGDGANKHAEAACEALGIRFEFIPPWAQELNEAEKVANIVWTSARAQIRSANLPDMRFLPYAVRYIVQRHYITATNPERG